MSTKAAAFTRKDARFARPSAPRISVQQHLMHMIRRIAPCAVTVGSIALRVRSSFDDRGDDIAGHPTKVTNILDTYLNYW